MMITMKNAQEVILGNKQITKEIKIWMLKLAKDNGSYPTAICEKCGGTEYLIGRSVLENKRVSMGGWLCCGNCLTLRTAPKG